MYSRCVFNPSLLGKMENQHMVLIRMIMQIELQKLEDSFISNRGSPCEIVESVSQSTINKENEVIYRTSMINSTYQYKIN